MKRIIILILLAIPLLNIEAKEVLPHDLIEVGVKEKIGQKIPLDVTVINDQGNSVVLRDLISNGKPTILNFVYYSCPMLCNLLLDGFVNGLKYLDSNLLERVNIITISMDPNDTPDSASLFKEKYLNLLEEKKNVVNWHFLTADKNMFDQISSAIGFSYKYNEKTTEYAHSAATYFLTPDATISRYLYGITYSAKDLKLATLEAAQGKTVSTVERVLLFCYNYDPDKQGFVLQAWKIMRVGGVLTVIIVISSFFYLRRQEKNRNDV